jgi:hypothetical protein
MKTSPQLMKFLVEFVKTNIGPYYHISTIFLPEALFYRGKIEPLMKVIVGLCSRDIHLRGFFRYQQMKNL